MKCIECEFYEFDSWLDGSDKALEYSTKHWFPFCAHQDSYNRRLYDEDNPDWCPMKVGFKKQSI